MKSRIFQLNFLILSIAGIASNRVTRYPGATIDNVIPGSTRQVVANNTCTCDNVLSMELFDANAYNQVAPGLRKDGTVICQFFKVDLNKAVKFIKGTTSSIYEPPSKKIGFTIPGCDTQEQCSQYEANRLKPPVCMNKGKLLTDVAFNEEKILSEISLEDCISKADKLYISYDEKSKSCVQTDEIHSIFTADGILSGNRTSSFKN